MRHQLPGDQHDHVLAGVKAKPSGWPAASPDPGSGRSHRAASGSPLKTIQQIQVSTGSGDCRNIAEIELSALTRQCLDRRIGELHDLNTDLAARQASTNADQRQVDWHFTTEDARIKLRHLYPNT